MQGVQGNSNTEPSSQCVPSSETGEEPPELGLSASKIADGLDIPASAPPDSSEEEPLVSRRRRRSARKIDIPAVIPSDTSEEEPLIRRRRAARTMAVERKATAHVIPHSFDEESLAHRRSKSKRNADTCTLVPSEHSDEQPVKRLRRSMRVRPSVDYREYPHRYYPEFASSGAEFTSHDSKSVNIRSDDTVEKPFIRRRHREALSSSSTIVDSTQDGDSEYDGDETIPVNPLPKTINHISSTSNRKTGPQLLCNLPPEIFELIQFIPPESTIKSREGLYLHESVRNQVVEFCHGSLSSATRDMIAGLLALMPEELLQSLAQTIEYIVRWCCDANPGLYGLEHILEGQDSHKRVVRWLRKVPNMEIAAAMGIEITGQQIIRLLMDRIELLARPAMSHQFALLAVWNL